MTLCLNEVAWAVTCPYAIHLNVGDTVKDCERIGLNVDYARDVAEEIADGEENKQIQIEQQKIIQIKNDIISRNSQELDQWQSNMNVVNQKLDHEKSRSKVNFWVGLGLGLIVAIGTGYAVKTIKF